MTFGSIASTRSLSPFSARIASLVFASVQPFCAARSNRFSCVPSPSGMMKEPPAR